MAHLRFLFCMLFTLFVAAEARAEGGSVALVIGNSAYESVAPLENPVHDAQLAADMFGALGFEVTTVINATRADLRQALLAFRKASAGAEKAAIYFAGHGVQADNQNYLLTTDTQGATLRDAVESSVSMSEVIAAFADTAKAKLLFLDACRNNPFEEATRDMSAGASRGLARANHERQDLLVIYAAQPNRVALDGRDQNSPFMTALNTVFSSAPLPSLQDALVDVTHHVQEATDGRQTPYIEGTLSFRVTFGNDTPTPVPAQCKGPVHDITLAGLDGFVTLNGGKTHLRFDTQVHVCPETDRIHISGPVEAEVTCETLIDGPDGGAGHYFSGRDGVKHHLWFHVGEARLLEIGVYADDQEQAWINTQLPLCRG